MTDRLLVLCSESRVWEERLETGVSLREANGRSLVACRVVKKAMPCTSLSSTAPSTPPESAALSGLRSGEVTGLVLGM